MKGLFRLNIGATPDCNLTISRILSHFTIAPFLPGKMGSLYGEAGLHQVGENHNPKRKRGKSLGKVPRLRVGLDKHATFH